MARTGKRPNSKDTISFRFPKAVIAKLRETAKAENLTLTDYAQKCVEYFLNKN